MRALKTRQDCVRPQNENYASKGINFRRIQRFSRDAMIAYGSLKVLYWNDSRNEFPPNCEQVLFVSIPSLLFEVLTMRAMRMLSIALATCFSVVLVGAVIADTDYLKDVKCIISGEAINKDAHASWKDGNVYFCCEKCQAAFEKEKDKHATKANHQLVATHQYEQEACPFTGGKLNKDTEIKVDGAPVKFCCNNCKGKAEKMDKDEQVKEIFGEKPFEKAKFTKIDEKKE